jgi:hypothetical protein
MRKFLILAALVTALVAPQTALALPPPPGNVTATTVPGVYPYVQQHVAITWTGVGYSDPTYPYTHYRVYRRTFRNSGVGTWTKIFENPCLASSNGYWGADDYDQPPNGATWEYEVRAQQTNVWCAQPNPENAEVAPTTDGTPTADGAVCTAGCVRGGCLSHQCRSHSERADPLWLPE